MSFQRKISRKQIKPEDLEQGRKRQSTSAYSNRFFSDIQRLPVNSAYSTLEQSRLLQLQQSTGNHQVSRMLASQWVFLQPEDKRKIDYAKAKKENQKYATSLGWDSKLADSKPEWAKLWTSGSFDRFADVVAEFQATLGFKKSNVNGILGPSTWDRVQPIGDVIAKQSVSWEKSASVCSIATDERLRKGYQRATGKNIFSSAEKSAYRIILHSIESEYAGVVEDKYRGTGAAGALVYLGAGEFVTAGEIWDQKRLKPGAAMQVWRKQSDLDRQKKGQAPENIGTSFVFVKYIGDDAMQVLHFNQVETMKRSNFEFWIGANLLSR